jgi:hypothetical protein
MEIATLTYSERQRVNEPYTPNMIYSPTSFGQLDICVFPIVARLYLRDRSDQNLIGDVGRRRQPGQMKR